MSKELSSKEFDINKLRLVLKKRYKHFLYITGTFLILAILYIFMADKMYKSDTVIYLDPKYIGVADNIGSDIQNESSAVLSDGALESQAIILHSRRIAEEVLTGIREKDIKWLPLEDESVTDDALISALIKNVSISLNEGTYIIEISFSSKDPEVSAQISGLYAKTFIDAQINESRYANKKGAEWLLVEISDLKKKVSDATTAVQNYRIENNIYSPTGGGKLVNENQLIELNSKLAEARALTATAKAQYEYSKKIVESGNINAANAEALDNEVINSVRTEYLRSVKSLSALRKKLGYKHAVVQRLQKEVSEYQRLLFAEMRRIMRSHQSDYEVSLAREAALEASLISLIGTKSDDVSTPAKIYALEQQVVTYQRLLEDNLETYELLKQREGISVPSTRVISDAIVPMKHYHPREILILIVAMILGGGISTIVVLYLEVKDQTIKKPIEVSKDVGVPSLGILPMGTTKNKANDYAIHNNEITFTDSNKMIAVNKPFSLFSETLRNILNATSKLNSKNTSSECKTIGIISALEDEGKSVVCSNLCTYATMLGKKSLYLDLDIRHPVVRNNKNKYDFVDLGEALSHGNADLSRVLKIKNTNLDIIPAISRSPEAFINSFSRDHVSQLIRHLQEHYDYIFIDLPPYTVTSDVHIIKDSVDGLLMVIEWGRITAAEINCALSEANLDKNNIIGAVINKANLEEMSTYGNGYHYSSYYQKDFA